jgi:battenin
MGVLLGFFLCGLINNVYYVVILSAAKSILPGDDAEGRPAYSSLLLAADTPALLAQFCGPMLLYFSFKSRVLCVSVLNAAALLIVASADSIAVRCCGVLLASLCFGLGESACLSALSAFDPSVIAAFSSGTGMAGVAGSALYWSLTSWLGLPWQQAIRTFTLLCPLFAWSFLSLVAPSHSSLVDKPESTDAATQPEPRVRPAAKRRIADLDSLRESRVLGFFLPLFALYTFTFVTNHAVLPHLADGGRNRAAVTYELCFVAYHTCVFSSRAFALSAVQLRSASQLWLLVWAQAFNFGALLLQVHGPHAWRSPHVPILLSVSIGLVAGTAYVHTLNLARQNIPLAFRESAMGLVLTATTAGPILAALLGMALEGALVP